MLPNFFAEKYLEEQSKFFNEKIKTIEFKMDKMLKFNLSAAGNNSKMSSDIASLHFPINSVDELLEVENKLSTDEELEKSFVRYLPSLYL